MKKVLLFKVIFETPSKDIISDFLMSKQWVMKGRKNMGSPFDHCN